MIFSRNLLIFFSKMSLLVNHIEMQEGRIDRVMNATGMLIIREQYANMMARCNCD